MFFWKNISSLSGITMLTALPWLFLLIPWIKNESTVWPVFFVFFLLSSLLLYQHLENLKRLIKGQEGQLRATKNNDVHN